MMADPLRRIVPSLAERFGMLPSEFRATATAADIVEILAYDTTNDSDWLDEYKQQQARDLIKTLTPEQHEAWIQSRLNDD